MHEAWLLHWQLLEPIEPLLELANDTPSLETAVCWPCCGLCGGAGLSGLLRASRLPDVAVGMTRDGSSVQLFSWLAVMFGAWLLMMRLLLDGQGCLLPLCFLVPRLLNMPIPCWASPISCSSGSRPAYSAARPCLACWRIFGVKDLDLGLQIGGQVAIDAAVRLSCPWMEGLESLQVVRLGIMMWHRHGILIRQYNGYLGYSKVGWFALEGYTHVV